MFFFCTYFKIVNSIGNEGTKSIAEALKVNTSIKKLYLWEVQRKEYIYHNIIYFIIKE